MLAGVDTAFVQAGLPGYRLSSELDRGGYGITFDGIRAGDRVAIKILDTTWHEAAIRTPLEINALRSIAHPNVVRLIDEGFLDTPTTPNRYRFIACEFVDGANLTAHRTAGHVYSVDEVRAVGRQISSGLQALHTARLIHRDVKPNNIMLNTGSGTAVLLDLGIAKHLEVTPVTAGAAPGTYGWKSPEHIRQDILDRRADLYSLGLVLYWMASGRHPFDAARAAHGGDLEAAMLAGHFTSAGLAQPALPPGAADMIDRMLAVQPYHRPRHASQVQAAF